MIIVYNYKDKKPFTIIGKKKSDNSKIPIPEIGNGEHIVAIQNIDNVEGTVLMRQPFSSLNYFTNCKISTNGNTFDDYVFDTPINIQPKNIVYFKYNKMGGYSTAVGDNSAIHSTVKYKVAGILRSSTNYVYNSFFLNETNLIDASELQLSNTLTKGCYSNMFSGCSSLTTAPELPATQLATECYSRMFYGCTSLTTAPELPATQLAIYCYSGMFRGCSSLTTAPTLPATTLASSCYISMFSGCTSLTTAPELPSTNLASSCYTYMFKGCTSLTTAPELPATTLANYCYRDMFYGCTSLTTAPTLPATQLDSNCYEYMFAECTALTTAPTLPATQLATECYSSMFYRCTALTTAPELPATTLANYCYNSMFYGCTSLNYIKHHIVDWNTSYTTNWLGGVAPSGTVECPANSTIPTNSTSGVPNGWTVKPIE